MFRDVRGADHHRQRVQQRRRAGAAHLLRLRSAQADHRPSPTTQQPHPRRVRPLGRRTAIDSPDAGRTAFVYDLADNLTAKETANLRATGQKISYAYEFTRLKTISYPVFPENNVTYTYGPASLKGQPGNRVGRITKITDAAGSEERLYGPLGETVEEKRVIPRPAASSGPTSPATSSTPSTACRSSPTPTTTPSSPTTTTRAAW